MSASNEWTEWHLTPTGWVIGSQKNDFQDTIIVTPPTNRVLTCKYKEYLSSSFSKLETGISIIWESDDKDSLNASKRKFGKCPEHLI